MKKHLTKQNLEGKIIDIHTHLGVSLKDYIGLSYPYAQSVEGLFYRMKSERVDVSVAFPFSPDLYLDLQKLNQGERLPSDNPFSLIPYEKENKMLMLEIFDFFKDKQKHFLPFISVDPVRKVKEQIKNLLELEKQFPIYGIKINPLYAGSSILGLLSKGKEIIEFAKDRNLPFLLHATSDCREQLSYAENCFKVIKQNPTLRFCLAHSLGFDKQFLEQANQMPNVWVDTSALKVQVDMAQDNNLIVASEDKRIPADFSDYKKVMLCLMEQFPETIIWGSDSPAYTYICQRKQGGGIAEFRLRGSYEQEKAGLDALPENLRQKAGNLNTLNFLFGK